MEKVLQLNQDGRPLELLTIEQAVCLVLDNKAIPMVEEHYTLRGRSEGVPYRVEIPTVIMTMYYVTVPPKEMAWSKRGVLMRDKNRCGYCGQKSQEMTVDHVLPRAQGGADSWENTVAACLVCNQRKGNRTPQQAGMILRTIPKKPKFKYHIPRGAIRPEWKPFLKE